MIQIVFKYTVTNGVDFTKFAPNLRRQLLSTMRVFGRRAGVRLRRIMRSGPWAKNSPPWVAAKGSRRVLYHTGHMTTSIGSQVHPGVGDEFVAVEVGWIGDTKLAQPGGAGRGLHEVIGVLTSGASWSPDAESKAAFWAKVPAEWKKNHAGQAGALYSGTWITPQRDFISAAATDLEILSLFSKYIEQASVRALRRSRSK